MAINIDTGSRKTVLDMVPSKCPYCRFTIAPRRITHSFRKSDLNDLDVIYKCTNENCAKAFVAGYTMHVSTSNYNVVASEYYFYDGNLRYSDNTPSIFSESINNLSKEFSIIYNQAEVAESKKLDRIAGMGYRKALEFLIKDYLIKKKPSERENIKKIMLNPCIQQIDDVRIKNIAERATWLGNDETHYTRKWIDKDVLNLKALIQLVVNYISDELLYEETMLGMPPKSK